MESANSFQNVINANGGLVTISGEVLSIKPPQGKGPSKCQIKDATGRVEEVGCWPPKPGKQGMIPHDALIGVTVNLYCSNKPYQGKNQFTGGILSISQMAQKGNTIQQAYDEAKAAQNSQPSATAWPKTPQDAPQSSQRGIMMPTEYARPYLPEEKACIVRQNAATTAGKLLEATMSETQKNTWDAAKLAEELINIAEPISYWTLTGKRGDSPNNY